jgi:small-conductance mechanosensitive channel
MMPEVPSLYAQFLALYDLSYWWGWVIRPITVVVLALIIRWVAQRLVRRFFWLAFKSRRLRFGERRARTIESLLMGLTTMVVSIVAVVVALSMLRANTDTLLFAIGLFSAGFGLGARPLVSDYLAGITLIFENLYSYGEKVEIMEVIGMVERVGLRTTEIRADSGELFVVPNGDVRVIRNFSRGAFSPATIRVTVKPKDLNKTLDVLERFAEEAQGRYGDEVIDHAEVISDTGDLSAHTTIMLVIRAPFAHGAQLRRRLLADVYTALAEAGIEEFA